MRRAFAQAVIAASALLAASIAVAADDLGVLAADGSNWALHLPADAPVPFHGSTNFDKAGSGPGSMMYPAPGPAGFVAALITHGVLLESTKARERDKIRQEADAVLEPYQGVLASLTYADLRRRTDEASRRAEPPLPRWHVESLPSFSLTQDQTALVLDNEILLFHADEDRGEPVYRTTLRMVSTPRDPAHAAEAWLADQGEALKREAARLFGMSLALLHRPTDPEADWRTVRYAEGGQERIERARVVDEGCNRLLLRNLRGWLLSVPKRQATCEPAVVAPTSAGASAAS